MKLDDNRQFAGQNDWVMSLLLRRYNPSTNREWVIVYFPALKVLEEFFKNS